MPALPSLPIDLHVDALHDLPDAPLCVGLSGGLDSCVLLHLLASDERARRAGLRAIHVHHGLHAQADAWAVQCERVCAALGIAVDVVRVSVTRDAGSGLEAAARQARHGAFETRLADGEVLVLGHHRDDQAETFLLRALRGSGAEGLGAMRRWRPFARGRLWRPLLDVPRASLLAYARLRGLVWIEDPSNADTAFDRNFLRASVMPELRKRWPQADAALARSAGLIAQADDLLGAQDAIELAAVRTPDPQVLLRSGLRALPVARRARVLRRWIAELGLPPLPGRGVERIEADLLDARPDSEAAFVWASAAIRCWRDLLHADVERAPLPADFAVMWDGRESLQLPTGDRLRLQRSVPPGDFLRDVGAAHGREPLTSAASESGSSRPWAAPTVGFADVGVIADGTASGFPVCVHARQGGERIRLPGRTHSHALKHVLQDLGVPPWQRERLPLLSSPDGELLAAGDLVVSAAFEAWLRSHSARLTWRQTP
ncbi:MAG: tRNA lysidine(34) synthetase TilS [Pseudomonadota bacterium]|nr:tRNA lysidine(34) synthetase TilS [Pseudomonadota bacterium]